MSRKYEEISPPDVGDFCNITDNTYNKMEVITFTSSFFPIWSYFFISTDKMVILKGGEDGS
jgi:cyclin A